MANPFDPNTFLDFNMDVPLVKRPPVAAGEYVGIVQEPTARPWVSPNDPTKSGMAFDYMIELDVPKEEQDRIGLATGTIKVKYGVMLDLMPDGKSLDMGLGKNSGLRRLREAVDMNKPGDSFSPRTGATGRPVKVKISHREYPPGSGDLFEEVAGISKVG